VSGKWLILFKAIIILTILALTIRWLTGVTRPSNHYVSMPVLIQESDTIKPPIASVLIEKSNSHKTSSAVVSKKYKTHLSQGQIFEHYRSGLELSGWQHTDSSSNSIDEYCKDKLGAEIEFNPSTQTYTFSVFWRQRTPKNCSTQGQKFNPTLQASPNN